MACIQGRENCFETSASKIIDNRIHYRITLGDTVFGYMNWKLVNVCPNLSRYVR